MRIVLNILTFSLLLLSCQNKNKQDYPPTLIEDWIEDSYQLPDTAVTEEAIGQQEEVKVPSTPTSSATSRSHESSSYDTMRGFDPVSEDDMEDNDMSRYMENNDEEGWD